LRELRERTVAAPDDGVDDRTHDLFDVRSRLTLGARKARKPIGKIGGTRVKVNGAWHF